MLPDCVGDGTAADDELEIEEVEADIVLELAEDELTEALVEPLVTVVEVVGGGPVTTLNDAVTVEMTSVDAGAGCHTQYW
jgi:hypothetical protein